MATAGESESEGVRVWPLDLPSFSTRRIEPLRHDLHRHPDLQLPRLAELARTLAPTRQCRFIAPGSTQASRFFHRPKTWDGRALDEVFETIEQPGAWIALYNVETHPAYKALLEGVVGELGPLIEREQRSVFSVTGFVFISAPPSVTPFHIDRENNFWLQIRGRKTLDVWDHTDRQTVKAAAVENFVVDGDLSEVALTEDNRGRSRRFEVGPGEGVYFPSTSPHMTRTDRSWATPGDGVSISLGIAFYTQRTRHHARVHQFNRWLRQIGLDPGPPGESAARDALKAPLGRGLAWARYRLRKVSPPPGAC